MEVWQGRQVLPPSPPPRHPHGKPPHARTWSRRETDACSGSLSSAGHEDAVRERDLGHALRFVETIRGVGWHRMHVLQPYEVTLHLCHRAPRPLRDAARQRHATWRRHVRRRRDTHRPRQCHGAVTATSFRTVCARLTVRVHHRTEVRDGASVVDCATHSHLHWSASVRAPPARHMSDMQVARRRRSQRHRLMPAHHHPSAGGDA